jgi:vacuolar-type H+-ATPase subunit H
MNEKHIQQVLEIEKQSQEIYDKAKRQAQELPVIAETEAQTLIAKAKAEAQAEAQKIIARAEAEEGAEDVLAEVRRKNTEIEALANANFEKAVAYVLERVAGRS